MPSGENAMAQTTSEWPSSMLRAVPVAESQSLTVMSQDADATGLPPGENATAWTQFEWPSGMLRAVPMVEEIGRAHV